MRAGRKPSGARRNGSRLIAWLLVAASGWACATGKAPREPPSGGRQRGLASWYGEPFHGRPTASGEIFDKEGLTAAHRALPLGTIVEVTNLDNGRRVRVLINDRGPFVRGRILDLSLGAARRLGMVEAGLARVEIRVVGTPGEVAADGPPCGYTVQIGAFREASLAAAAGDRWRRFGEVAIHAEGGWHRVRIGRFERRAPAEALRRRLHREGQEAMVVRAGC